MFWKKNRKIDEFAQQMADEFFSQVQPDVAEKFFETDADDAGKKSARKNKTHAVSTQLDGTAGRLKLMKEELNLGVYGKARFHMKFMSRLEQLGYSKDLAGRINQHLMLNTP